MSKDLAVMDPLKRHWIARTSNIPRRFWGRDASDIVRDVGSFPPEVTSWLDEVLAGNVIMTPGGLGSTGVGLLFDGKPGMGKTTHAVTALLEFIYALPQDRAEASSLVHLDSQHYGIKFRPIYYVTMTELLNLKKSAFDSEREDRADNFQLVEGLHGRAREDWLNVRILVLDDLGKEYGSKYDEFSFDELLRSRYDKGLPTILTTNKLRENWGTVYSESMGSFAREAFQRVVIEGRDLRR
jgi:DNA replication protein DnaC